MNWQPIGTAPKDGTFLLLLRQSGYVTTPFEVVTGRFVPDFRDGWIDVHSDRLTDSGNDPTHWMPMLPYPEGLCK